LENETHLPVSQPGQSGFAHSIELSPFELDFTGIRSLQPGERVKQSRFASTGCTAKKHTFPALNSERNTAQHFDASRPNLEGTPQFARDKLWLGHEAGAFAKSSGPAR
jgi:hypothetical protein